jgi:hypothetical protein
MADAGTETRLVTVGIYETSPEAHIARAHLEAEGVDAVVVDEHIADYNLFYGRTMGGIRLLVREEDARLASSIVEPEALERPVRRCPQCDSTRVVHSAAPRRLSLLLRLLLLPLMPLIGIGGYLLGLRWRWCCEDCGATWRDEPDDEGDES